MKLLLYSHFFAPSVGGVETIVLSLARGLAELRAPNGERSFEITLVTQTSAAGFDDCTVPFRVVRQPGRRQLWRLIRAADVVHVAGAALAPIFFALLARKPVVVEHHGFQTICPNGQLLIEPAGVPCPGHFMASNHARCLRCNSGAGWIASIRLWLLTFLRRFLCFRVAANITPTAWQGGLLHLPHSQCIPHGLPVSASEPRTASPDNAVIAFQGRLVTTKGARQLLEAARILRGQKRFFELLIIGDGPERASLEQFARDSKLETQVHFHGRLSKEQLEATLERVSVVVVPSLGGEVFGLVVAENMARGLPVVASDLGAFTEVLADTGVVFRTGDAEKLAAALVGFLDDPSLAATLGRRARQRVKSVYGLEGMIEAHASLYSRFMK
jgi:glycosyltransferase involved in cell wall biosynthesis